MRRIALISEHASPLAVVGSTDAGGQNIYVAQLAAQLARSGYAVDVFTRRDRALLRPVVQWKAGVRVVHVPAGPARFLAKEEMLPHMDEFARNAIAFFRSQAEAYRLVHANFFMSGMVAQRIKRALDLPFVRSTLPHVAPSRPPRRATTPHHPHSLEPGRRFRTLRARPVPTPIVTTDPPRAVRATALEENDDVGISGESPRQVVEDHGFGSSDDHQVGARRGVGRRHGAFRGISARCAFHHEREPAGRRGWDRGRWLVADQLAEQVSQPSWRDDLSPMLPRSRTATA